jgi:hypothetical protein
MTATKDGKMEILDKFYHERKKNFKEMELVYANSISLGIISWF